jgi:hypothetical protein
MDSVFLKQRITDWRICDLRRCEDGMLQYFMHEFWTRIWEKPKHLLKKPPVHLVLIALVGLLAYSNTFNSPFMWDEQYFLFKNPFALVENCVDSWPSGRPISDDLYAASSITSSS